MAAWSKVVTPWPGTNETPWPPFARRDKWPSELLADFEAWAAGLTAEQLRDARVWADQTDAEQDQWTFHAEVD